MKFNLEVYKNIIINIKNLYDEYKKDPFNEKIYQNIRVLLDELSSYITRKNTPVDLMYRTEKTIYSMYRLLEYHRIEKNNKK